MYISTNAPHNALFPSCTFMLPGRNLILVTSKLYRDAEQSTVGAGDLHIQQGRHTGQVCNLKGFTNVHNSVQKGLSGTGQGSHAREHVKCCTMDVLKGAARFDTIGSSDSDSEV